MRIPRLFLALIGSAFLNPGGGGGFLGGCGFAPSSDQVEVENVVEDLGTYSGNSEEAYLVSRDPNPVCVGTVATFREGRNGFVGPSGAKYVVEVLAIYDLYATLNPSAIFGFCDEMDEYEDVCTPTLRRGRASMYPLNFTPDEENGLRSSFEVCINFIATVGVVSGD